jgi:hypothetical protein
MNKLTSVISLNDPVATEKYLAETFRPTIEIRELKNRDMLKKLSEQATKFRAKGIKNLVLNAS